jgi:nicotinamidase-related amidase
MDLSEAEQYDATIGFAAGVGFGQQPALLIIDCNRGCADPALSRMGIAMEEELIQIRWLLELSRAKGIPVVYTTMHAVCHADPTPRASRRQMLLSA